MESALNKDTKNMNVYHSNKKKKTNVKEIDHIDTLNGSLFMMV